MIDVASFGWPQWLYLLLFVSSAIVVGAKHGENLKIHAGVQIGAKFGILLLLIIGGFFRG